MRISAWIYLLNPKYTGSRMANILFVCHSQLIILKRIHRISEKLVRGIYGNNCGVLQKSGGSIKLTYISQTMQHFMNLEMIFFFIILL